MSHDALVDAFEQPSYEECQMAERIRRAVLAALDSRWRVTVRRDTPGMFDGGYIVTVESVDEPIQQTIAMQENDGPEHTARTVAFVRYHEEELKPRTESA